MKNSYVLRSEKEVEHYIGILYEDDAHKNHLIFTEYELQRVYDPEGNTYFRVHTTECEDVYVEMKSIVKMKIIEV